MVNFHMLMCIILIHFISGFKSKQIKFESNFVFNYMFRVRLTIFIEFLKDKAAAGLAPPDVHSRREAFAQGRSLFRR